MSFQRFNKLFIIGTLMNVKRRQPEIDNPQKNENSIAFIFMPEYFQVSFYIVIR